MRRSLVEQRAAAGNRAARYLLPIISDPDRLDRYVAGCQIGITVSSLLLGAYGQAVIATALAPAFTSLGGMQSAAAHSTAAVIVLIALSALQMLFGELVPKTVSLQAPIKTALGTVPPMRVSLKLFAWFIAILNGSGVLIMKLMRVKAPTERHRHSAAEIEEIIAESSEAGALPKETGRPLQKALKLAERTAGDLMVPRENVHAVELARGGDDLLREAARGPYTRLPIYDGSIDNVLGIIHAKDLMLHELSGSRRPDMRSLIRATLRTTPDMPASALLSEMRDQRCQTAIVTDRDGRTVGFITADNILQDLLGGIADEFKKR